MEKDITRVLVVFTDGDDNFSKVEVGAMIEKARKENVHIYTVAFGYSKDSDLKDLAQYTGGKFYKAYTKDELISIFRDIYMSLRYYYLITYKPPKYWGYHKVFAGLNVPGRSDTLIAIGEYNTSDLFKDTGNVFVRPILFDFDSAVVKPVSYPIIDEIVDAMLSKPTLKLEIQGHTDNVGTIEYNQKLSEARAQAVMEELIKRGVEARCLRFRGFGMSQPVAPNDTEEGRSKNRRTQFMIIAK
jgi:outer membrane protein OmpA-like peptidoglycan-associated protein